MNTNPDSIKVLCYGDSNTHGQKPDKTGRYEANIRWTGILQGMLGERYYVIEEGLGSRTTNLGYAKKPGRNGKTYLAPCLQSHNPLDIVTIMLGSNDLKIEYQRSAEDIAIALGDLIDDVHAFGKTKDGKAPTIILICPIEINAKAPRFAEFYTGIYNTESMIESKKLPRVFEKLAEEKDVLYLNAAAVSTPGEDGLHFNVDSQRPLAELIFETVRRL